MREDYTHCLVILDGSGSMEPTADDTIGGINSFIKDQKKEKGKVTFTLVQFSYPNKIDYIYENMNLRNVKHLNSNSYKPDGGTALLKAVEESIDNTGEFLASLDEKERPAKVVVLIVTDGQENASGYDADKKPYTHARVRSRIEHQRDVYNWEFVFLGANLAAVSEGAALGVSMDSTLCYTQTGVGTRQAYKTVSGKMSHARGASGNAVGKFGFTQQEREDNTAKP